MKDTGMIRKVDPLGRISLPVELRRNMKMAVGDLVEFYVEDSAIIVRRYEETCVFCDRREDDMAVFHGKKVCLTCLRDFREKIAIGTGNP